MNYELLFIVGTGDCWTAESDTNGAPVTLQKCVVGSPNQAWLFTANSPFRPGGSRPSGGVGVAQVFGDKCLDVKDGVDAVGTRLQVYSCFTGNKNQMWQLKESPKLLKYQLFRSCKSKVSDGLVPWASKKAVYRLLKSQISAS